MNISTIDINENRLIQLDASLLDVLLKDRSSNKNLIWATDDYSNKGKGYQATDYIYPSLITNDNEGIIKPRADKTKNEQLSRVRDRAEVFTPSWLCNKQNNLVDEAWFGRKDVFNIEDLYSWHSSQKHIWFPTTENKSWKDYVQDTRLEIACGEAPYLVSRYDTVSGDYIELEDRIGLLDRKMRVVNDNTATKEDWYKWTLIAYQNTYGFDWQGDNILLARENLLISFIDYYYYRFSKYPSPNELHDIANILSWNLWQMDSLKGVIPYSCIKTTRKQISLFEDEETVQECEGCANNQLLSHTGIYCRIMDWKLGKTVKFISLMKEGI